MPGSCEFNSSSSNLISSLRNFRFQNKSKSYQPPSSVDNLSKKDSGVPVPDSTSSKNSKTVSKNKKIAKKINQQHQM
ncbi:hypothetical protein CEXT_191931 [Caerostris extrusa]|uniref:Uncharacterized protein n=1 Tax=Caerostris extrusa TaxID=172846 RepID=A0AAV4UM34_CAEEX|nr:hypothetical protein CEXT_191931 [Caerostris extrusa]